MKTYLIKELILALGLLSTSGISGQKVITNHASANGYPVIDLSELTPLGCILTSAEASIRRSAINQQTASNTDCFTVGIEISGERGVWNKKMSSQFQVMRANMSSSYNWAAAHTQCKQYNLEGGAANQWRLPTQRELMMILVLHPQLMEKGGFTKFDSFYYWSCTEQVANDAWAVIFNYGYTNTNSHKTQVARVRCVRDL